MIDPAHDYLRMTAEDVQEAKATAYEAAAVKFLTARPSDQKALLQPIKDSHPEGKLTLLNYCAVAECPVLLAARQFELPDKLLKCLDRGIQETPIFRQYAEAYDDLVQQGIESEQFGMIFPWPDRNKFMIFSDAIPAQYSGFGDGGSWFKIGACEMYLLETLSVFQARMRMDRDPIHGN